MKDSNWTNERLCAAYTRSIYNERMKEHDWKILSDEIYTKIKSLRKVYMNYITKEDKEELEKCCNTFNVPCDDVTVMIYNYLVEKHTRGKNGGKIGKSVVINGIRYDTINDAANALHTSRAQIYRMLKTK